MGSITLAIRVDMKKALETVPLLSAGVESGLITDDEAVELLVEALMNTVKLCPE